MNQYTGSGAAHLSSELRIALAESNPSKEDPLFGEVWKGISSVTNLVGSRLLEKRFGADSAAAWEVQMYLQQLDRVSHIATEVPLRVPLLADRAYRALARYVEVTQEQEELITFLLEVPTIAAACSAYAARVLGRHAAPLVDVLNLSVRAGSVYEDALRRTPAAQALY